MLAGLRNRLYELIQERVLVFGFGLGAAAVALKVWVGTGPQLALVSLVLGWLAWEARPNLYFALGMHEAAARAARSLAQGAGPSMRGDVHRLTEAAAELTVGDVEAAKQALAQVDPDRLPPRGRFVHFLNLSALFCRLGDGASALAMLDAADAEPIGDRPSWRCLPAINRSAALAELGRYDEAAACLQGLKPELLPGSVLAYVYNNLAWNLALGSGDKVTAVQLAERAATLRGTDAGPRGTLGVALVMAGAALEAALPHLEAGLERLDRRSPHGRAVLLAAGVRAYRGLGDEGRAARLEAELRALPGPREGLDRLLALVGGGPGGLLPEAT